MKVQATVDLPSVKKVDEQIRALEKNISKLKISGQFDDTALKNLTNQLNTLKINIGTANFSSTALNELTSQVEKALNNINISGVNIGNINNGAKQTGQQIGSQISQGISQGMASASKSTEKVLRDFSELNDAKRKFVDGHDLISKDDIADAERLYDTVRKAFSEFGQVTVSKGSMNDGSLENMRVKIEQVNGEMKITRDFMLYFNESKNGFKLVDDDTIRTTEKMVQHLNEEKNIINATNEEANAIKAKLAEQEKYYGKLGQATKEQIALEKQRITAGEKQLEILEEQTKRRDSRISYNEGQIDKKGLSDVSRQRKINDLEYSGREKIDVAFGKELDKSLSNLSKLKEKWQEQGIYVDEFKSKVELLEKSLNEINIGDVKGLNSFKEQISSLTAEAKQLSQIHEIQLSIGNGDYDTQILAYETSLKKLGLTSQEVSEKMKNVSSSYGELKNSATGDNIISDNVIAKANTLENEMSKLDNVVKQIKLKDSLQADDIQVEQTIIRLNNQLQKNSKYSKEAKDKIRSWISELEKGNVASETLKQINVQAKELHSNMSAIGRTGQTFIHGIINKVKSLSTYISGTVIIGKLLHSGKQVIDFSRELDKAITNINYTMDVSSDKLADIGKQSIDTAKDLKTSAENVLDAVTTYANANETAESILSKSKPTIMLSNVTGMDTATTTDILQGTIHQFDLEDTEKELYHVSDVLQAVSKSMAVDFSKGIKEMAEGIQVSGSVANDAGYDLERYSAILGNLIEKTRQSGSELGRSLRTMFVRTTKASTSALAGGEVTEEDLSNAEAALRRVGIEVRDSKEEFRDFDAIMTDLYNKIDDLSEVDLSNIAYEVASTRQTAVFKVMVKTWGDYLNLSEQAYNASGETLENQEKYAESLQGKFEGLGSTIESIYSNLANSNDIGIFVDGFQKIADAVDITTDKLGLLGTISTIGSGYAGAKGLGLTNCVTIMS